MWRGHATLATDLAEDALAGFRKIDDRFGMIQALSTLNRAYIASGRFAEADRSAEEAVNRLDTTGANVEEGRVVQAFGRLLDDDVDGALAKLIDVDVEVSPFALAARSTALAIIGDNEGALSDVLAVEAMDSVSYWDLAIARSPELSPRQATKRSGVAVSCSR